MNLEVFDIEALQAEKARRGLLSFTEYTKSDYETNWHHRVTAEYLDLFAKGEIKRLMLFQPPRFGKTELASRRLPGRLLGMNPDNKLIACSYSASLASRINRDVQRVIDDPAYKNVYPGIGLSGKNVRSDRRGSYLRNSEIFEIVGHSGQYISAGVGGAITGSGCNIGLIDDPIKNKEEAKSKVYRDKIWEWYTSTFYTRLEKDGQILIIQTRWHEDDLSGRILQKIKEGDIKDDWVVVSLPAIMDTPKNEYDKREIGEPLWPAKYDLDKLHEIKSNLSSYDWSALYQQRPSPEGGSIIRRDDIKLYSDIDRIRPRKIIQSWDMSFKQTEDGSYVVGQVWGKLKADYYLIDQFRQRIGFSDTLKAVQAMKAKHPDTSEILIEDKANGPAVIDALRREVGGIIPMSPRGSKESRASAISYLFEAGNVYIYNRLQGLDDYIEELTSFPSGVNDDQVDATSMALDYLDRKMRLDLGKIRTGAEIRVFD
jgi:predicted phage terminase large subunit-like protein